MGLGGLEADPLCIVTEKESAVLGKLQDQRAGVGDDSSWQHHGAAPANHEGKLASRVVLLTELPSEFPSS